MAGNRFCLKMSIEIWILSFFVSRNLKNVTTPLLLYNGDLTHGDTQFRLLVDNEDVAQPLDLIHGVECLLASYYVLNIAYPPCSINTLTFLLMNIVGLRDKAQTHRKVLSLLLKLSK